jgi:hypothetical protein
LIYFYLDQQSGQGTYNSGELQKGEGDKSQRQENEDTGDLSGLDLIGDTISNSTETGSPPKKRVSSLSIIIIDASIVAILLIGLLVLFSFNKKRHSGGKYYNKAATSEQTARS